MEELLDQSLGYAFDLLVPVIGAVVVALVVRLFKLAGLQIDEASQNKMKEVAESAVLSVEEWAAARIKANLPVTSGDKFEAALTTIINKLPNISEEEAAELINEALPRVGAGAADFLSRVRAATASKEQ